MPTLSPSEMADKYGIQKSYFDSDPDLKRLLERAVKGNWTPEKFLAEAQNTNWYKKQSDTRRAAEKLKATNPATYKQKVSQVLAQLQDVAKSMGANVTPNTMRVMAEHAVLDGWNDSQIKNRLSHYVVAKNGIYGGSTGDALQDLESTAWKNGIHISAKSKQAYAQAIARGDMTVEDVNRKFRDQAKAIAPGYADQLNAGMDLYEIASPYMQSMSKILELNPAEVDLFDPKIRGALNSQMSDGKIASKTLAQFEKDLRKDPRWMKTNNARDSLSSVAHQVATDWGLM